MYSRASGTCANGKKPQHNHNPHHTQGTPWRVVPCLYANSTAKLNLKSRNLPTKAFELLVSITLINLSFLSQFVQEFFDLDVAPIQRFLASHNQPFQPSELYSSVRDAKFIDVSLRLSQFRAISDETLFALARDLVEHISDLDSSRSFKLHENEFAFCFVAEVSYSLCLSVTEIRYQTGGFFSAHRDYLSLTSNIIEGRFFKPSKLAIIPSRPPEYTLLVNVNPAGVETSGGHTNVTVNPAHSLCSAATATRGGALLFRKDLLHEGLPVLGGEKHLLSLNVWATVRRQHGAERTLLLVKFVPPLPPLPRAQDEEEEKKERGDKTRKRQVSSTLP